MTFHVYVISPRAYFWYWWCVRNLWISYPILKISPIVFSFKTECVLYFAWKASSLFFADCVRPHASRGMYTFRQEFLYILPRGSTSFLFSVTSAPCTGSMFQSCQHRLGYPSSHETSTSKYNLVNGVCSAEEMLSGIFSYCLCSLLSTAPQSGYHGGHRSFRISWSCQGAMDPNHEGELHAVAGSAGKKSFSLCSNHCCVKFSAYFVSTCAVKSALLNMWPTRTPAILRKPFWQSLYIIF